MSEDSGGNWARNRIEDRLKEIVFQLACLDEKLGDYTADEGMFESMVRGALIYLKGAQFYVRHNLGEIWKEQAQQEDPDLVKPPGGK